MVLNVIASAETVAGHSDAPGYLAGYGVIDAAGGAALFEVGNHTFRKYDATDPVDAPNGFIVRTNFAFTGDGSGTGQVRYDRGVELLNGAALAGGLTHDFLLRRAARDLKNDIRAAKAMLADGLTLADVVTWTDGETTLKEATRLADLATEAARS